MDIHLMTRLFCRPPNLAHLLPGHHRGSRCRDDFGRVILRIAPQLRACSGCTYHRPGAQPGGFPKAIFLARYAGAQKFGLVLGRYDRLGAACTAANV